MVEKLKRDILSLSAAELETIISKEGQPKYRAEQIFSFLHGSRVTGFDQMTSLPGSLRIRLDSLLEFRGVSSKETASSVDGSVKALLSLHDSHLTESVLLSSNRGKSVCVSSQVGCKMGCVFCASGKCGFVRNLSAGEMLSQVYFFESFCGESATSVMLMGMGEPLNNFDSTLRFIENISHPKGKNLSPRHISVSTCGLPPEILRLAKEKLQITLSISLHAPFDKMRSELMPINKRHGISELKSACDAYLEATHRRISLEYAVISGLNDTSVCADELRLLFGRGLYHINLIRLNPTDGMPFPQTSPEAAFVFQKKLAERGLNATVRRRQGADISAACGQLALRELNLNKTSEEV